LSIFLSNIIRLYNPSMLISARIRALRDARNLSQADIQKRSGLVRPYLSRIENGHTIPSLATLEKLARALEVPLYQMYYEGDTPLELPHLRKRKKGERNLWGSSGKEARFLIKFRGLLGRMKHAKRKLLLDVARKMVKP
jgi:transcriptional regulator with XRE-family HTH domain